MTAPLVCVLLISFHNDVWIRTNVCIQKLFCHFLENCEVFVLFLDIFTYFPGNHSWILKKKCIYIYIYFLKLLLNYFLFKMHSSFQPEQVPAYLPLQDIVYLRTASSFSVFLSSRGNRADAVWGVDWNRPSAAAAQHPRLRPPPPPRQVHGVWARLGGSSSAPTGSLSQSHQLGTPASRAGSAPRSLSCGHRGSSATASAGVWKWCRCRRRRCSAAARWQVHHRSRGRPEPGPGQAPLEDSGESPRPQPRRPLDRSHTDTPTKLKLLKEVKPASYLHTEAKQKTDTQAQLQEIHGPHRDFIKLSIKDYQAKEEQEMLRSRTSSCSTSARLQLG